MISTCHSILVSSRHSLFMAWSYETSQALSLSESFAVSCDLRSDCRRWSKIYPSNFKPSPCHRFIKVLENRNKVCSSFLANVKTFYWQIIASEGRCYHCSLNWWYWLHLSQNYTQNIDTLEQKAGIKRVLHCHGSFQSASCINCHVKVPGHAIEEDLMASRVPVCKCCNDAKSLAKLKRPRKKKKKKKRNDGWESDDDDYTPPLPPGIMKVCRCAIAF